MSKANVGCLGWFVAGALLIFLIGKCAGDPAPTAATSGADDGATPTARTWRYVQPAAANCRSSPSTSAASLARLPRNSFVTVVSTEGGWSQLDRSPDCWVRSDLLASDMASEPAPIRGLLTPNGGSERGSARRSSGSAYYANCSAARAAGADPVMRGDPGYSRRLDRDGDGVGCE